MDIKIRVTTVLGTVRPGNFTGKALAVTEDELRKRGAEVTRIDPATLKLALPGQEVDQPSLDRLRNDMRGAHGILLATPEYHGSYSAAIKLIIENLGFPSGLAEKPVALLGVAAGSIGAIKALEHLRSVVSHVGAIALPGPVSVANVQSAFDADGACKDPGVEKRLRELARFLLSYTGKQLLAPECTEKVVRDAA